MSVSAEKSAAAAISYWLAAKSVMLPWRLMENDSGSPFFRLPVLAPHSAILVPANKKWSLVTHFGAADSPVTETVLGKWDTDPAELLAAMLNAMLWGAKQYDATGQLERPYAMPAAVAACAFALRDRAVFAFAIGEVVSVGGRDPRDPFVVRDLLDQIRGEWVALDHAPSTDWIDDQLALADKLIAAKGGPDARPAASAAPSPEPAAAAEQPAAPTYLSPETPEPSFADFSTTQPSMPDYLPAEPTAPATSPVDYSSPLATSATEPSVEQYRSANLAESSVEDYSALYNSTIGFRPAAAPDTAAREFGGTEFRSPEFGGQ